MKKLIFILVLNVLLASLMTVAFAGETTAPPESVSEATHK